MGFSISIVTMSDLKKTAVTNSASETIKLGKSIARNLKPGDRIYLYGELGSGKTTLTKGICRGLGIKEEITSSSFVIATEYTGKMKVIHIDLYRLEQKDIENLPVEEYFTPEGLTIIEWADRLAQPEPGGITISLKIKNKNQREISIESPGH